MEKINVAMIGAGKWGKRLAESLEKFADIKYIVHSGSPETKGWVRTSFPNAKVTEDLTEVLRDKSIQAVAIATPINTHFEITLKALQACKHVFLEKPGTNRSKDLAELIAEAEKRSLVLQIGYEFVFASDIEEIKKIVAEEEVKKISFSWKKWGTFDTHPVINLLVHELSILKAAGVWPIKIGKYAEIVGEHNPDSIHLEAKAQGIDIIFDIDRASKEIKKEIRVESNKEYIWEDKRAPLLDLETKSFVDSISGKTKPLTDGIFAKDILETIEQIPYRS